MVIPTEGVTGDATFVEATHVSVMIYVTIQFPAEVTFSIVGDVATVRTLVVVRNVTTVRSLDVMCDVTDWLEYVRRFRA